MEILSHITLTELPMGIVYYALGLTTGVALCCVVSRFRRHIEA